MKITVIIYKSLIRLWKILPAKRQMGEILRNSGFPVSKFYNDLRFAGPFSVNIPNGSPLKLYHFGGSAESEIFWLGAFQGYDIDTGWFWMEICPKCNVIFDVGANIGVYGLVAKCLNPNAQVHSFEPAKHTFKQLSTNIKLNQFDIVANQVALSNTTGTATFYDVDAEIQYSASLSPNKLPDKNRSTYDVPTVTLSEYLERSNIRNLDLMKIDVELFEPEVIMGFSDKLYLLKPIVLIEVLTKEVAERLNKLVDSEHLIYRFRHDETLVEVPRFEFEPYEFNFLFFHKDRLQFVQDNTSIKHRVKNHTPER